MYILLIHYNLFVSKIINDFYAKINKLSRFDKEMVDGV